MKDMNELPGDILDLIAYKKYEELSPIEKQLVDQHLSPEAYNEYAQVVTDFQELDDSLPAPQVSNRLPEAKPSLVRQLFTYRIPAYQAVAATVIALFLFYLGTANPSIVEGAVVSHTDSTIAPNAGGPVGIETRTVGTPLSEDNYPEELVFNL